MAQPSRELQQVADYRILRTIGRGGMGVVYEAEQLSLGRRVAIKFLPAHVSHDAKLRARFRREARAAAQLHHTNIVPVFDVGQQDELCYYAMQLIRGQGLDQVLLQLRQLPAAASSEPPPGETAGTATAAEIARSLCGQRRLSADSAFAAESEVSSQTACEETFTADGDLDGGTSAGSFELAPAHQAAGGTADGQPDDAKPLSAVLPGESQGSGNSRSDTAYYYRSVADLGVQIADALAYAHAEGIVHRDIKPSNLLLDARGIVWITDFGLAKIEEEGLTRTGDIVGTLRYMAPEGFAGRADARSDVYSLGTTLYEMLALRPAFDEPDRLALVHQITHDCPPRLRSINPGIPADLETIVMKAIERQPEHRYQSARDLESDLQRFLDDKPIAARQTGRGEQLWRWCRRNPAVAALATAVVLLLVTLTTASTVAAFHFRRIADQREQARTLALRRESQAERNLGTALNAVNRFFVQVSEDPRLKAVGLETLRRDLLQSAREFYTELAKYEGGRPDVLAEQAKAYMSLAEITDELGSVEEAIARWRESESILRRLVGEYPGEPEYRRLLAQTYSDLSRAYPRDRPEKIEAACQKALRLRERLVREAPENLDFLFELAASQNNIGNLYRRTGRIEEAEAAQQASFETRQSLVEAQPDNPKFRLGLATLWNNLGVLYKITDRRQEAERAFRKAIGIDRRLVDEYPGRPSYQLELSRPLSNLGGLLQTTQRLDQAEASFQEAIELRHDLSEVHPDVPGYHQQAACSHCKLGSMYRASGRLDEAAAIYRRIVAIQERLVESHPDNRAYCESLSHHANKLGIICKRLQEYDEAEKAFRRSIELRGALARAHPENTDYAVSLAGAYCNLAGCFTGDGSGEKSLRWRRKAESMLRKAYAANPGHYDALEFLRNTLQGRANTLYGLNRFAKAVPVYAEAVKLTKRILAPGSPEQLTVRERLTETDNLQEVQYFLGMCHETQQHHDKSDRAFRAAIETLRELVPTDPERYRQELGERCYWIGDYVRQWGRHEYATEWFNRSIEAFDELHQDFPGNAETHKRLRLSYEEIAKCYEKRGAPKKAAEARKQAQRVSGEKPSVSVAKEPVSPEDASLFFRRTDA